ncbi:hypothetical protein FHX15_005258 [Rhizobium sp. BK650]|nr:hypothetical protein [Rhizobium sp. BK650]
MPDDVDTRHTPRLNAHHATVLVHSLGECLNGIARPVFMSMPYPDHENCSVLLDPVDNEMGFERMDSNWRRNLFSLARRSRISCNEIKHRKQFVMIPPSLCGPENAHTLFGDRNDILFRFD